MNVERFASMGCEIVVGGEACAARDAIEALFGERDRVFSRFRGDSELSRVNESTGRPVRVSDEFASMVALALRAAGDTEGLVDPTLAGALEGAGYDTDFELLRDDGHPPVWNGRGTWRSVRLVGRHLILPSGVKLDLNGVVKGKTVDDALRLFDGDGFVSAGGDLAVRGSAVVALPAGGTVTLVRSALATSGTDRRHWSRGGAVEHHLIDPRTGVPSGSPWLQVTACGATCVAADVAAKAGFLLGEEGPDWLDARRIPARFVSTDERVRTNEAWRRSVDREHVCT